MFCLAVRFRFVHRDRYTVVIEIIETGAIPPVLAARIKGLQSPVAFPSRR